MSSYNNQVPTPNKLIKELKIRNKPEKVKYAKTNRCCVKNNIGFSELS